MVPYMITSLSAFYDTTKSYFVNVTTGGFGITLKSSNDSIKYITGLLNSKLLDWFIRQVSTNFNSGYFAANKQFLTQLPIRAIDFSDPIEEKKHQNMESCVERMLSLHKQLAAARTPGESALLQRQVESTDRQIDRLVYALYGLSEEEIKIVEGG